MIRILQVVNNMHRAGLETMLMNYYRNIDRECVQFDFLVHRDGKSDYDDEILSLGGKIYHAPRLFPQNYPRYFRYLKKFFAEHPEYKVIHSHIDSMSYLPLLAAKKAGVPVRIAHSHNTSIDKDYKYLLKQIFRFQMNQVANYRFACGEKAGEFLFRGKPFQVIPNAIDTSLFLFSEKMRSEKRRELGVESEIVIGHVGRLSYQKNHKFLIEIFQCFQKKHRNSILLLIGTGEKEEKIRTQIKSLNLENHVQMLGSRSDVNELYQAMDLFLLPSYFEGIPVTGIEAQMSGLPCLFSDKVPGETQYTSPCRFLSLKNSPEIWADECMKLLEQSEDRACRQSKAIDSPFNIEKSYALLQNKYIELNKN